MPMSPVTPQRPPTMPIRPPARRAVRLGPTRIGPVRQQPPFPADRWLPDGVRAEVAGLTLAGGMIYVGTSLPADTGAGTEPP